MLLFADCWMFGVILFLAYLNCLIVRLNFILCLCCTIMIKLVIVALSFNWFVWLFYYDNC